MGLSCVARSVVSLALEERKLRRIKVCIGFARGAKTVESSASDEAHGQTL